MKRLIRFVGTLLVLILLLGIVESGSVALSRTQRQSILKSTVLILPLKFEGSQVKALWRGSGTIVDARGLILTNYHVVDESGGWDFLGILVTTRSDQRPEPAYRAEVVAKDPKADLAVIRIISDPKGNPLDLSKLNLVPVPLGNADDLEIGDELSIFGYPGIGDDTITLTEGQVSGFLEEEGINYRRAWIKTDASVSGGNSGGAAVDENGKLVGVPTRSGPVDARPVADTNGDGVIDSNDSPVSAGGFINRLRPVNLAFSLIEQARKGNIKSGDSKQPTPSSKSPGTLPKGASFSKFTFASKVDSKNKPLDPGTQFASGITRLYAFTDYSGMTNDVIYTRTWSLDGEVVLEQASAWNFGSKGTYYQSINYSGDPLPEGEYGLKLTVGGVVVRTGSAVVGKKRAPNQPTPTPQPKGVTLSGYLVDADTGRGIAGGYMLVLKPGISVQQVRQDRLSEQVAAIGQTDKTGYFRTAPPLPRGYTYSAIAIAEGYKTIAEDDALTIEASDPDEVELNPIGMVRQ